MSSSKHHHHHSETGGQKKARKILAFFLFLVISGLSLSLCLRGSVVSKGAVIDALTSDTYVSGVYKSVTDYSRDLCDECSIPYDGVDKAVTYDKIYKIQEAYYNGLFSASDSFTETTYQDYIATLGEDLNKATAETVKAYNLKVEGDSKKACAAFSKKVTDYVYSVTELSLTNSLKAVVTMGGIATVAAAIGFALIALVLILIIVSIGSSTYRALRNISHSLYASALLNILLVLGVTGVKHFKTLVLYPDYLSKAIMQYVNNSLLSVSVSSAFLFILALCLTAVVWNIKKNENS